MIMQIEYSKQVWEKINLPDTAVNEIAIRKLYQLLGGEYFLKKDCLYQDDPEWRHGSVTEIKIRKATELDLAILQVLKILKEFPK